MSEPNKTELYRWIDRAREAEARVAELENGKPNWPPSWEKAPGWPPGWALEVCDFLKQTLEPPFGVSGRGSLMKASRLFTEAIALGIIPEPDCPPGLTAQSAEVPLPFAIIPNIPNICPKCGKRIISDLMECGNTHDSGAGPTKCALAFGHSGSHESADKREGWGI